MSVGIITHHHSPVMDEGGCGARVCDNHETKCGNSSQFPISNRSSAPRRWASQLSPQYASHDRINTQVLLVTSSLLQPPHLFGAEVGREQEWRARFIDWGGPGAHTLSFLPTSHTFLTPLQHCSLSHYLITSQYHCLLLNQRTMASPYPSAGSLSDTKPSITYPTPPNKVSRSPPSPLAGRLHKLSMGGKLRLGATAFNPRKRRIDPDDDRDEVADADPNFGSYFTSPRDKAAKRRALLAADAEMDMDSDPPHASSSASSSSDEDLLALALLRTQSPSPQNFSSSYSKNGPPQCMSAGQRPSHTSSSHLSSHSEARLSQPSSSAPRSSSSQNRFGLAPPFEPSVRTFTSRSSTAFQSPQPDELEHQGVRRIIHHSSLPDGLYLEAGPESYDPDSYQYSDPPSAAPAAQPGPSPRRGPSSHGTALPLEEDKNRNAMAIILGLVAHMQNGAPLHTAPPTPPGPTQKPFASTAKHQNVATSRSHASHHSSSAQASSSKPRTSPVIQRERKLEESPDIVAITPPPPPPQPEPILVEDDNDSDQEDIVELEVSSGEEPAYHQDHRGRASVPRNQGERAMVRLGKKKVERLISKPTPRLWHI